MGVKNLFRDLELPVPVNLRFMRNQTTAFADFANKDDARKAIVGAHKEFLAQVGKRINVEFLTPAEKGKTQEAAHRAASHLWSTRSEDPGAGQLALLLQGAASERTGVDIHPGAAMGAGVFIDHATGIVIGEQAAVGDDCYILHGVTLGATGKEKHGRRHPHVGSGCTLGNGANVLGPITVGDGATIGTGATVTKDVEAGATVIDTGFMSNKVLAPRKKKS